MIQVLTRLYTCCVVKCIVDNVFHFKLFDFIYSDTCPAGEPAVANTSTISPQLQNPLWWLWVVISLVGVILVVTLILLIFCIRKKNNGTQEKNKSGEILFMFDDNYHNIHFSIHPTHRVTTSEKKEVSLQLK